MASFDPWHPELNVRSAALELDTPKLDIPKLDIQNGHPEPTADTTTEQFENAWIDYVDPYLKDEKAWINYVDPPTGCSWWASLEDAITQGMIEERRSKWIGPNSKGIDAFRGAFRIHAPENKSFNNTNYQKIVTFEFFLWTNVVPQPTFEYLKRKVAQTVDVHTTDFFFETLSGKKLDANKKMLDEHDDLPVGQDTYDFIYTRKCVDIRMVVPILLEWTFAE
jgi:hypothetical protein